MKKETERERWIRLNVMTKEKYAGYLQDRRWYEKKNKILALRGTYCLKCGNTNDLHIHHLTYEGKYPWDTSDEHLICLCNNCHNEIHDETNNFNTQEGYKLIEDFNNSENDTNLLLCFKGNKFINECSIETFKTEHNISDLSINKCCLGITKSCKGYNLKYAKINRIYDKTLIYENECKKYMQELYAPMGLLMLAKDNKITAWEYEFLSDLIGKTKLSDKQKKVIIDIRKNMKTDRKIENKFVNSSEDIIKMACQSENGGDFYIG